MTEKIRILAVVGPTASGKSSLALGLARRLGGEIVCCDSMQIYKEMNIGTAKPSESEREQVAHHLFDFVSPRDSFSCADYVALARDTAREISLREKLPVFCGGTGLYLDRLLNGAEFEDMQTDPGYREELKDFCERFGNGALHERLREIDPESANAIHPNNVKRVIRALEIYKTSGKKKSELDRISQERESDFRCVQIGLRYADRETLYKRIDARVDIMLREGLLEETERLLREGIFEVNSTAAQAIGYKELLGFLRGERSLADAVDELKRATRRYAKRQMTWFSSHGEVEWINADGKSADELLTEAEEIYKRKG